MRVDVQNGQGVASEMKLAVGDRVRLFAHTRASFGNGRAGNIDWTLGGLGRMSEYRVGNQFLWDPVKNLEFGLELDYAKISQRLAHDVNAAPTALPVGVSKNPDAFEARLRVERDF